MLEIKNIGGIEIFRSSQDHERRIYNDVKNEVFKKFSPGRYTDKPKIVDIVNLMYTQYYKILDENLPLIDPRNLSTFLICEYERYGQVSDSYKLQKLCGEDEQFWLSYGIHARRGIKHILELLCRSKMETSQIGDTKEVQEDAISMVFIAAEELVSLYMRSDNYRHMLDEVTLILDPEQHTYFNVQQDGNIKYDIREDVRDISKYVPTPMYLQDTKAHGDILDNSFIETLGLSYLNTIGTLQWAIYNYSDSEDPEAIGWFDWEEAVRAMQHAFNITKSQAELILEGFSLAADAMEERKLTRPKQEYRAYKRAFFKDCYNGKNLVFFSRRMALECLTLLVSDVPFRKLPPEWQSSSVSKALNDLSLKSGRWFEKIVEQNLKDIGITGSSSVKSLNFGKGSRLKIPNKVGEIDFLGFHEEQKLLVIIEVKQVGFSTEPRMFLDDLSKFIKNKDNYSDKFIKKYKWAMENIESIEEHFVHNFNLTAKLNVAGYAMITLYPTMVASKISEFSCISLSEFRRKYQADEKWPFSKTLLSAQQ